MKHPQEKTYKLTGKPMRTEGLVARIEVCKQMQGFLDGVKLRIYGPQDTKARKHALRNHPIIKAAVYMEDVVKAHKAAAQDSLVVATGQLGPLKGELQ